MRGLQRGFTLVEVLVVAPIIILSIGAFIALVITLTGSTLESREASVLQYNVQDAIDRIDEDVRLSARFLAKNDIAFSSTNPQGYNANPDTPSSTGSTTDFTNISNATPQALILKQFAYTADPLRQAAGGAGAQILYLNNQPNSCSGNYRLNTPLYTNVVYFVAGNALWRRVVVPNFYNNPLTYCGGTTFFQRPTCAPATTHTFCAASDTKLLDGISENDFNFTYYNSANAVSPNNAAKTGTDAARDTALQNVSSVQVSLTARKNIAGRETVKSTERRATRLNSVTSEPRPFTPASITMAVVDGSDVDISWQSASYASVYDVDYRLNGGAWQSAATNLTATSYKLTEAINNDTVSVRVIARNNTGSSTYATKDTRIPLWSPLPLEGTWTRYSSNYSPAMYSMTSAGFVVIKGMIKASAAAQGSTIAQLPAKYQPTGRLFFGNTTNSNASSRVDLWEDGKIVFMDGGNTAWYSLDSIRYTAKSAPYTRTTPTLLNGFTNYGGAWAPASYVKDSAGRVVIQGLLANGTRTNGTVIFSIPAASRPSQYMHFPSRSGTFHHLGIDATQGLLAKGDGTGAYSINVAYLPGSYSGWINLPLSNGWANYSGSGFTTPQYTKTSDGVVHLKGLVASGTLGAAIATLPPGYRPAERLLMQTPAAGAHSRLDVWANGQITAHGASNTWVSLDGISFIPES